MGVESNVISVVAHTGPTVANTDTSLLAANTRRTFVQISNASNEGIWVSLGTAAVMSVGIYVPPNGGVFTIDRSNMWTGSIRAICASGGKVVGVLEGQ